MEESKAAKAGILGGTMSLIHALAQKNRTVRRVQIRQGQIDAPLNIKGMRISNSILHFAKASGLGFVVIMIWLTASRSNVPARYANDQPKVTGNFIKGKAEGTWTWWYENGNKMTTGVFVSGKRNGKWDTWYSHGNKKSQATYKDDKLNGNYLGWHENGKLKYVGNYNADQLDGLQEYYDTAGLLKEEKVYIEGKEK